MSIVADNEALALAFLAEPRTCTELGERLWGATCRRRGRAVNRQSYARPAGKLTKRLLDAGKIKLAFPRGWEKRPPLYVVADAKYENGRYHA